MVKRIIAIQKTITVLAVVGVIGTMGGFEWGDYGLGRMLLQSAGFLALMVYSHNAVLELERLRRLDKRQRKARTITVGNGSNYQVVLAPEQEANR